VLAQFAGEGKAVAEEKVRLQRNAPGNAVRAFGGLSRQEVEHLCRHYQAGSFDLGAFLLVRAWRQLARDAGDVPVPVARASVAFLANAISGRRSDLLKRLVKVAGYFDRHEVGKIDRITYGHAQWWKLCVLLYLLNHPKPSYRTSELCGYRRCGGRRRADSRSGRSRGEPPVGRCRDPQTSSPPCNPERSNRQQQVARQSAGGLRLLES
jgi:hypothetical protein